MQLHQIGWIGSICVLLPVLSWCYFNSVSQKRSFMWETSGGWSEGWTEHKKLANDMMIRMEGDVYQEQSLSKGRPEWTDGGKKHPPQGFWKVKLEWWSHAALFWSALKTRCPLIGLMWFGIASPPSDFMQNSSNKLSMSFLSMSTVIQWCCYLTTSNLNQTGLLHLLEKDLQESCPGASWPKFLPLHLL